MCHVTAIISVGAPVRCMLQQPLEISIRVFEKVGMKPERVLRNHIKKWDTLEDVQYFGILRSEYELNR